MADIEELQEKLAEEGTDEEEEDYGSNEPVDLSFLEEEKKPSVSDVIAARAVAAGQKVGTAARGLLGGIGRRIEAPAPPGDDLSDLFEGPDMERDNDVYIKDLVTVEEEDVFGDGGEDMSDLLEVDEEEGLEDLLHVSQEDIMGTKPKPKAQLVRTSRQYPPTGLAGVQ